MSEFADRARWAYHQKKGRERGFSQAVWAERIGKRLQKGAPSQTTVGRWMQLRSEGGTLPDDLETVEAAALEVDVDPGWLAFGPASEARAPAGWSEPPAAGSAVVMTDPGLATEIETKREKPADSPTRGKRKPRAS